MILDLSSTASEDACVVLIDIQGKVSLISDEDGYAVVYDSPEQAATSLDGHLYEDFAYIVPLSGLEPL